jgi:hypothetical protein
MVVVEVVLILMVLLDLMLVEMEEVAGLDLERQEMVRQEVEIPRQQPRHKEIMRGRDQVLRLAVEAALEELELLLLQQTEVLVVRLQHQA